MKSLRVLLLGDKSVGKSAIAVRFLTKRYIGEYRVDCEILYKQTITCDDVAINLEILDFSTSHSDNSGHRLEDIKHQIIWAQAYIVVYSICDPKSFLAAQYYLNIITKIKGITNINVPIVLLGNKRDLEVGRKVGLEEGRNAAIKCGSQFYEISAAENYVGVTLAFHGLLREARSYYDRSLGSFSYHSGQQAIKKLSLNSVTRAFGAVFGNKNNLASSSQYTSFTRDGKICYLQEPLSSKRRSINGRNGSAEIGNGSCKQKKDQLFNSNSEKQGPPMISL